MCFLLINVYLEVIYCWPSSSSLWTGILYYFSKMNFRWLKQTTHDYVYAAKCDLRMMLCVMLYVLKMCDCH